MPADQPLVLHYGDLKGRFGGWDRDGHATFGPAQGRTVTVNATVNDVKLKKKSPSVSIEDDVAYFTVDPNQHIPKITDGQRIDLLFDQYALYDPKRFGKGDRWKFVLNENQELVSLRPILGSDEKKGT